MPSLSTHAAVGRSAHSGPDTRVVGVPTLDRRSMSRGWRIDVAEIFRARSARPTRSVLTGVDRGMRGIAGLDDGALVPAALAASERATGKDRRRNAPDGAAEQIARIPASANREEKGVVDK